MNDPQSPTVRDQVPSPSSQPSTSASTPATTETGIEGLELDPGEFMIAVGKPGFQLWLMVVIFAIPLVTIPLSIWLFKRAGKYYVVTNRRSIRVARNGDIDSLTHDELEEVEIKDMIPILSFGKPSFPDTLKLEPTSSSAKAALVFASCSRTMDRGFTRLWGALHYWVRHPELNVEDAPAVDVEGRIVDAELDFDVLLIPNTDFGAMTKGVLILTDTWIRFIQESTEERKMVRADFPAYGYLHALARRSNGRDDFLKRVDRGVEAELMTQHLQSQWSELEKVRMTMGTMSAKDTASGSRLIISVPKPHRQEVKAHMEKLGVL